MGTSGAPFCSACAIRLRSGARFCDSCGRPVDGGSAAIPKPLTFTPEHIAEKIRASREAVEGERKQVTVLFADLTRSMELGETVDPEDWRQIMERYFGILCDGVHRFEGIVDRFTGDGIMALFGAPIAHEDHAQRACFTALHLREELGRYGAELHRQRGLDFAVRVGLNSGEVVVGTIAEDLRVVYTAIGNAVGVAKRVETMAEPGHAYVTEHTAALAKGYFELRELGRFEVKGVREPIGVLDLVGRTTLRTPLEVAAARGFSRFVGREKEMDLLESARARAIGGSGSVVGVVADPGVGKSRLYHEFSLRCRAQGMVVCEAHALSHTRAVPFMTMLELMRNFFEIRERDDDEAARQRVLRRLEDLDERSGAEVPLLLDFLGIADAGVTLERMDPEARRTRLFAAFSRLLRAASEHAPGVILIEDLHWLDGASGAFVEQLVGTVAASRSLLLVNYRPEYNSHWRDQPHCTEVELKPLGGEATDQLLTALLGSHPSLDGLAELMRERTGGNPFFIEEAVRSLAEGGTLEGRLGAYRLTRTVGEVAIPETVKSVLASRLDRLEPPEKGLLQIAAVIGNAFSERLLREVAGIPKAQFAAALSPLVASEFLDRAAASRDSEYVFRHPLTEEVAYQTQLTDRRSRIHRLVAKAIIKLDVDRLDERAALIAQHWEAAGDALEAARWGTRAANWAGFNDPAQATQHWRKVLELTRELATSEEVTELGMTAGVMILYMGWRLGSSADPGGRAFEKESRQLFAEGRELAQRGGQDAMLANLYASYGTVRGLTGHIDEFMRLTLEAVAIADRTGDSGLRVAMRCATAYPLYCGGRLADGLRIAEEGIELTGGDPTVGAGIAYASPYATRRFLRGMVLGALGRLPEGFAEIEVSLQQGRERDDLDLQGWAHLVWPWLAHWARSDHTVDLFHAQRAVEIAERTGGGFSRAHAYASLAEAHLLGEDWDAALEACDQALTLMRGRHIALEEEPLLLSRLARARLARGELLEARTVAEEAVQIAHERRAVIAEVQARHALAQVLLSVAPLDAPAIRAELERCRKLIAQSGFRAYEPQIHLLRGELARLLDKDAEAACEFESAHRLFGEIGADGWVARTAVAS